MSEPLDLEAIKKRAEAATPGPWRLRYLPRRHAVSSMSVVRVQPGWNDAKVIPLADVWLPVGRENHLAIQADADASFIAHARQDVPALIAEVESLRAALSGHLVDEGAETEYNPTLVHISDSDRAMVAAVTSWSGPSVFVHLEDDEGAET